MKKFYYFIAATITIIVDIILLFTIGNLYYIFLAIIVAEIAIYATAIIYEVINVQNQLKDLKKDDENEE